MLVLFGVHGLLERASVVGGVASVAGSRCLPLGVVRGRGAVA